ncbi:hypothetical protein Btru_035799 [Bulinus truncatus]|nr:hypothetical protein Btru_035799 [Bulinus truncatus]
MFYSEVWMLQFQYPILNWLWGSLMMVEVDSDASLNWDEFESIISDADVSNTDSSSLTIISDKDGAQNISHESEQFVKSLETQVTCSTISSCECGNPFNIVVRCLPQSSPSSSNSDPGGQDGLSLSSPLILKQIYSGTIKEELRCRIQLKRVNMGEAELQVDYKESAPTISYEAVQKRNEIREKNKMYAKQSRERAKELRKGLADRDDIMPYSLSDGFIPYSLRDGFIPYSLRDGFIPYSQRDGFIPYSQRDGFIPYSLSDGLIPYSQRDGFIPYSLSDGFIPYSQRDGFIPYSQRDGFITYSQRDGFIPYSQRDGFIPN